ncbi:hypothetical protein BC936DRAFT_146367 [Jimgerdemannia flammicorona]|uniref:Uncharacterized protein n=1 Tax=Jimgerdemannia flammicorona TaxID=994334 RepID=A0A433D7X2_9FUNG|nr:hypothetical protein BC936DRAFT_146367 [Jimgerdemannia flammicorona]
MTLELALGLTHPFTTTERYLTCFAASRLDHQPSSTHYGHTVRKKTGPSRLLAFARTSATSSVSLLRSPLICIPFYFWYVSINLTTKANLTAIYNTACFLESASAHQRSLQSSSLDRLVLHNPVNEENQSFFHPPASSHSASSS